jgi:uncharacterized protein (UPF0548 family)
VPLVRLLLRRPRPAELDRSLANARVLPPGIEPTGRFEEAPPGFRVGSTREVVGTGAEDFERAATLVRAWAFLPTWAAPFPPTPPQAPGESIVLVVRTFGVWSVLPARILQTIETGDGIRRAGFVYSALSGHVAQGYERFLVEYDEETQRVTFDLTAVARPATPLLRLVRPLFTLMQRNFRSSCMRQLRQAITNAGSRA